MSKVIKISSISPMAMTEDDGLQLRREIGNALKEGNKVILDFKGIDLFATPFFNSSIGYYVMNLSPDKFNECVQIINLSDLGKETFSHSYQNAVSFYENKTDLDMMGKITAETISEQ